jgi:hypothetical protein
MGINLTTPVAGGAILALAVFAGRSRGAGLSSLPDAHLKRARKFLREDDRGIKRIFRPGRDLSCNDAQAYVSDLVTSLGSARQEVWGASDAALLPTDAAEKRAFRKVLKSLETEIDDRERRLLKASEWISDNCSGKNRPAGWGGRSVVDPDGVRNILTR